MLQFQFTLPRGERRLFDLSFNLLRLFQFTLPRGERLLVHGVFTQRVKFQFTLPRGERQLLVAGWGVSLIVSIHAPARGATYNQLLRLVSACWFQFTLPRGERQNKGED